MAIDARQIAAVPLRELYGQLQGRGAPGSAISEQESRILNVRIAQEIAESVDSASKTLAEATEGLTAVLADAASKSDQTASQLLRLNVRLFWLTWLIAVLTIVLVAFGAVQLWLMWSDSPTVQHAKVSAIHDQAGSRLE